MHHPHQDALVVIAKIGNNSIHKILIDNSSAINILYANAYQKMGFSNHDLKPTTTLLYEFTGDSIIPRRRIVLAITMGEQPHTSTVMTKLLVINDPSSYNTLFGRPILKDMKAVISIYHQGIKFPTAEVIGQVRGSQFDA